MARTQSQKKRTQNAPDASRHRIWLMLVVLALTLFGFVMIFSASSISAISEQVDTSSYLTDQLVFAAGGVFMAVVFWKFLPYRFWAGPAIWVFWGGCMALLALTALMGTAALGAQRWLSLGPISLQPSEFAKIGLVLMAARVMYQYKTGAYDLRGLFVAMFLFVALPTLFLYFTQSDLGTTAIILLGVLGVLWYGEVPVRYMLVVLGVFALFAAAAIFLVGYRMDRMLFLNPWNDGEGGRGAGYQIIHSFYAFAEGGLTGVGLGNSREKFLYLPESETDFIYSIIGEEWGLIGSVLVIVAFLVLLWAGLQIARAAKDDFGCMVAGALTIMLVFQAFLNIGCAIGALPTTGKPLPFISSGGSSLIASFIMVGLILSVADESIGNSGNRTKDYERRREQFRITRRAR